MPAGIHFQDRAGTIEQLSADFHIDTEGRDGYEVRLDGDYFLAGDGAIYERSCGNFCEGCPSCFDSILDAEI
jgi:hypothetical protein